MGACFCIIAHVIDAPLNESLGQEFIIGACLLPGACLVPVNRRGWLPGVEVLVSAGAKQGVVNKRGLTALAEALVGNHTAVADLLLKSGADPLTRAGRYDIHVMQ